MKISSLFLPLVGVAAIFAVGCSAGDTIVQPASGSLSGVSATGTGVAIGEPDIAIITVGVNVERDSVEQARADAADAQQAVIDSLKANGVDDADIQTVQFSVQPRYNFNRGDEQPEIIGYSVNNVISVKIRDIDTTGKAIDDAVAAGGNDAVVQGVSFTIDDPEELRAEARKLAVEAAMAQAEQLADAAGVNLGSLLTISENGGGVPFAFNESGFATASDSAVSPIQVGELEIRISVSLVYALDQ